MIANYNKGQKLILTQHIERLVCTSATDTAGYIQKSLNKENLQQILTSRDLSHVCYEVVAEEPDFLPTFLFFLHESLTVNE